MDHLRQVEDLQEIRVLADEGDCDCSLMAEPATLSRLGHAMGKHPAWVRHHLKQLEEAGLVELSGTREIPGFTESTTACCLHGQRVVTPVWSGRALLVTGNTTWRSSCWPAGTGMGTGGMYCPVGQPGRTDRATAGGKPVRRLSPPGRRDRRHNLPMLAGCSPGVCPVDSGPAGAGRSWRRIIRWDSGRSPMLPRGGRTS